MKPIAYINVEKRTLEFAEPIKWHTPTVANLDRIPLFTKEALAQLEQKPVAWKLPDKNVVFWEDTKEVDEYHGFEPTIPLYPHPQRKPLTDEEIDAVTDLQWAKGVNKPIYAAHRAYARAIEAAHGIKENT